MNFSIVQLSNCLNLLILKEIKKMYESCSQFTVMFSQLSRLLYDTGLWNFEKKKKQDFGFDLKFAIWIRKTIFITDCIDKLIK